MKQSLARIALVMGVLCVLQPLAARADGLFVPEPDYWVRETQQEAVVFFEDGHEDLIVSSGFEGNADNFAWIIPTPSQPTVERGSWELFAGLRDITETNVYDARLGGIEGDFAISDYVSDAAVKEIERQSVAYYDIAVLDARTTDGLLTWFTDNGFYYPEDQRYILDDYIAAGWYFTTVKLNTTNLSNITVDSLRDGMSLPLHLSFATDRMVFPLQLSQVTGEYHTTGAWPAVRATDITLYLISDHKQSLPQFTQYYAGYLSAKAVSELSFTTDGKPMLLAADDADKSTSKKYVLTKLGRYFPIAEMTYDLYPREEENTDVLNADGTLGNAKTMFWVLIAIGGVLTAGLGVTVTRMGRHSHIND
jgi:hypothetical protein